MLSDPIEEVMPAAFEVWEVSGFGWIDTVPAVAFVGKVTLQLN